VATGTGSADEARIVGRRHELAALATAVRRLDRPMATFVAVTGEPGIGKTRLLDELAKRGTDGGHLVLTGRGSELERELPFGVWVDALDDHVAWLGLERLKRMLGDRVGELALVLPSAGPAAAALPDERFRAHRAVRALAERLAAIEPLVVVLDDLHWADGASLELVVHLLRRPPRAPLLVAMGFRAGRLPPEVSGALEAAFRDGLLVDLRPGALSAREAGELLGESVPAPARAELHRASGGNPFYLLQLAHARPAVAGARAPADPIEGVPAPVAAALGQEIASLTEAGRRLAQGAAVAGDPVQLELAATAADLPEPAALAALDELVAEGLLRGTGEARRYRFRHPIVRRTVYETAGEGWRLGAHARAASDLARRGGSLAARAHHVERCAAIGDEEAITLLVQAGHEAAPRAPAAAVRWFGAALRLMPERADDVERRLGLLVPLATSLAATGELERALAALLETLALVPVPFAEMRARLVGACAACENMLGRHRAAHDRLLRVLEELPDADGAAAGSLQVELAADALYDTDFDAMVAWAELARATAHALGDPTLTAVASALLCFARYGQGDVGAAEAACAEAATTLDALPDEALAGRLDAAYYLGFAEFFCERFDDAIRHLRRGITVSRAVGQGQFVVPMMVGLAHALEVRGRLAEALDTAEGAVEAARLAGNPQLMSWALVAEGWIAAMTGDLKRADAAAEEAVALIAGLDDSVVTLATHAHAAAIFLEAGRAERCLEQAHVAGAPELASIEPGRRAWLQAALARAELALGRRESADAWVVRAERTLHGVGLPLAEAAVLHAQALLALDDGQAGTAAELANRSAARADAVGATIQAARSRVVAGRALGRDDDRRAALVALARADSELAACGAHRLRDEAARELRRLGQRAVTRQRRTKPGDGVAALSGREREIADLVAAGRKNREIAAELFLSEKTIEGHLANVFAKLGVSSRAAVAASIAREHTHRS
jgi:DNA-binding NarL/FixJ family response regulator